MALEDSYEVQLATKMQLILDQPSSDMSTKLVNADYEGEFFKIGDTVSIVKPDVDAITVEDGVKSDTRPDTPELDFSKAKLEIDRSMKYGFLISDITTAEGKWNYESGALDLAAQKMRKAHNLDIANLIANDSTVPRLGTPAAPVEVTPDEFYTNVLTKAYTTLFNNGAISADAQYTYGSNPQEQKRTAASCYFPMEGMELLLQSKFFTDRSTDKADNRVETANIGKVLGMELGIEPSLSQTAARKITVDSLAADAFVVIAGTANCVTKAGKVLKPDKQRDTERFADKYTGLEIYGRKVFNPKCAFVAFVKVKAAATA